MNIYAKLAKARVELQGKNIKKSGKNTHLKFSYMELEDFLPIINLINLELGLLPAFTTVGEVASLTIYNTDRDMESIVFTSPTAHAKLQGGASAIQELGSQHTYMRRYLYLEAYEITEKDSLDPAIGDNKTKPKATPKPPAKPVDKKVTKEAIETLIAIATLKSYDADKLNKWVQLNFKKDTVELTESEYEKVLDYFSE